MEVILIRPSFRKHLSEYLSQVHPWGQIRSTHSSSISWHTMSWKEFYILNLVPKNGNPHSPWTPWSCPAPRGPHWWRRLGRPRWIWSRWWTEFSSFLSQISALLLVSCSQQSQCPSWNLAVCLMTNLPGVFYLDRFSGWACFEDDERVTNDQCKCLSWKHLTCCCVMRILCHFSKF